MKSWRKQWSYDWLMGNLRQCLSPEQRAVCQDLMDLANISRVDKGIIAASEGKAYRNDWVAAFLGYPLPLLESTLEVMQREGTVRVNGSGIEFLNWGKYQSEYNRQKPYRKEKKTREERVKARDYTGGEYGKMVKH